MRNVLTDFFSSLKSAAPSREQAEREVKLVDKEVAGGSFYEDTIGTNELGNLDTLIQHKGLGVIDEMLTDDAIGAFMRMRKEARLATSYDIEPAGKDAIDLEVAEFVRWALFEYCETAFRDILRHLYSAIEYGYSLAEKVLAMVPDGKYKGKYAYIRVVPQKPHLYSFRLENGKRLAENGIVNTVMGRSRELPTAKFLHYAYNSEWGNPYGKSDVARAYNWYVLKKYSRRFLAIYLERMASGFVDASFDETVTSTERENLKKMLEGISAKTWMMHPSGVTVNIRESSGTGGATFNNSISLMNIFIARTLLTPDLLGFSAKPSGSYALGRTHLDMYTWVLKAMGEDVQHIVRDGLIEPLVLMNYGPEVAVPRFVFEPITMSDKLEILTSFYAAVEKGIFNPMEITDEQREWVLKMLTAPHNERPEEKRRAMEDEGKPKPEDDEEEVPEEKVEAASDMFAMRRLSKYEAKVDFASVKQTFDTLPANAVAAWRELAIEQRDAVLGVLRKRQLIERKAIREIRDVRIPKIGRIDEILRNTFVTAYLNARYEGWREMRAVQKDKAAELGFDTFAGEVLLAPLEPREALAHFAGKGLQIAAAALAPYTQKAFLVAGVEKQKILAEVHAAILKGIEKGNVAWTEGEIRRIFDGYIETGEIRDGALSTAYRIENIVRTNVYEAYNAGRKSAFEDADVRDYIEAYEVSAVLDSSTTAHCQSMDGRILSKEELEIYGWPPWHYNCRTIIVPVVRGESFTIDGIPAGSRQQFGPGGVKVR